jgi:hypothetical protein
VLVHRGFISSVVRISVLAHQGCTVHVVRTSVLVPGVFTNPLVRTSVLIPVGFNQPFNKNVGCKTPGTDTEELTTGIVNLIGT